MRLFEIPTTTMVVPVLCLLLALGGPVARADFTFGEPVDVKTVIPVIDYKHDEGLNLSYDGLEMYFDSDRPGGLGAWDVWRTRRDSLDADWGPPENLGPAINGQGGGSAPTISADGLTLYFMSMRSKGCGNMDIYVTTRATKGDPWGEPVNLGSKVNSSGFDGFPYISSNGLELYIQSERPGGYGGIDIYVSTRATAGDPWGAPVNLGPVVNSIYNDAGPCLSPDGLVLFFQDYATSRPGGYGKGDLWMTRRADLHSAWGLAVNLGPDINGPGLEACPHITPDGTALYFLTASGDFGINWQVPIIPTLDFNADGNVDLADLALLIENQGSHDTLYDIGPFAWGDGKVDIEDMKAFVDKWEKENPSTRP